MSIKWVLSMKVVKRDEAKEFSTIPGIDNKILVTADKQMFVLINISPEAIIPLHGHKNEQIGVCLKGTVEFQTEEGPVIVEENTAYAFASNEKHGCRVLSKDEAIILESVSPPREDFLAHVKD